MQKLNNGIDAVYLVIVVMAMEERLLPEDHAGQHAAETPHVQTVIVHLERRYETRIIRKRAGLHVVLNSMMTAANDLS